MYRLSDDPSFISGLTELIESYYKKAEQFFNLRFTRPMIKLNLKGRKAGTATPSLNLLRFNKELLLNNQQQFLQHTVPHEIAHLLAYQLFGPNIRPHGKEWQHIMNSVYQIPAQRCHSFKVEKKIVTYYVYGCACQTQHYLTIRRHNAIKKAKQYACKHCQKILYYKNLTLQRES